MQKDNIKYDIRWSNQIDPKFIRDFRNICSKVFHYNLTQEQFELKFLKNIYGPSVLVVVYINSIPSAARSLWRNDINNIEAYQPGDTCVLDNCRGKGIFSEMTKRAIEFLPENSLIYNFPNQNSLPGYLKMGWKLFCESHMKLFISYKEYVKEHPLKIDKKYANWWLKDKKLLYFRNGNHHFIVNKDHRPFVYRIIGEVSKEIAKQFPRIRYGLFFYSSKNCPWYSKKFKPGHIVTRNPNIEYIPNWKIDAL